MNSDLIKYMISDYVWIGCELTGIIVMLFFIVKLTKKRKNIINQLESDRKKNQEDLLEQSLANEKRR